MGYMVVRGIEMHRVFMEEIGTVVLSTPAVSVTMVWVVECLKRKIKIVICDEKRNPLGEILPYRGSHDSSKKIREQILWDKETKQNSWQIIIQEKIAKQKEVLLSLGEQEAATILECYEKGVEKGDITNREGFAAKVYFNTLWGKEFSRRDENHVNAALNYGYSIILSLCNREIASAGYMTQLGIFHDNVFNPFNLGSDLMEPFRPLVDKTVIKMTLDDFSSEEKKILIDVLNHEVIIQGKKTTVSNAMGIYVRSVFKALAEEDASLIEQYRFCDEE